MEEISVLRRKSKRLLIVAVISVLLIGVLIFMISQLFKPKVISPVQDSGNVRIIFVTPHPTTIIEVNTASESATPKASSKVMATPKPTPKASPKATPKSATDSAE